MSDTSAFGFGKFIPGFDFLQNLGKAGQGAAAMPSMSHWIAPTVSVEEIDKRIEELKAVQFWLEQNSRALAATVQALEVQRMTLSTLKGMNVNLGDLAKAFPFAAASVSTPGAMPGHLAGWPLSAAAQPQQEQAAAAAAPAEPAQPSSRTSETAQAGSDQAAPDAANSAQAASMATAMQWWGALTQQFQQIAQQALQDPVQQQAMAQARQMTSEFAQAAVKTAGDMVRQAVSKAAPAATPPGSKKTPAKNAATPAKEAAQPAAKRRAPAKKAVPSDKKPISASAKTKPIAAKRPGSGNTRPR